MTKRNEVLALIEKMGGRYKNIISALDAHERLMLSTALALDELEQGLDINASNESISELHFASLPPVLRSKFQLMVATSPAEGGLRPEALTSLQRILNARTTKSNDG